MNFYDIKAAKEANTELKLKFLEMVDPTNRVMHTLFQYGQSEGIEVRDQSWNTLIKGYRLMDENFDVTNLQINQKTIEHFQMIMDMLNPNQLYAQEFMLNSQIYSLAVLQKAVTVANDIRSQDKMHATEVKFSVSLNQDKEYNVCHTMTPLTNVLTGRMYLETQDPEVLPLIDMPYYDKTKTPFLNTIMPVKSLEYLNIGNCR